MKGQWNCWQWVKMTLKSWSPSCNSKIPTSEGLRCGARIPTSWEYGKLEANYGPFCLMWYWTRIQNCSHLLVTFQTTLTFLVLSGTGTIFDVKIKLLPNQKPAILELTPSSTMGNILCHSILCNSQLKSLEPWCQVKSQSFHQLLLKFLPNQLNRK